MRRTVFVVPALALALSGIAADPPAASKGPTQAPKATAPVDDWVKYVSPDKLYRAEFPKEPKVEKQTVSTSSGDVEVNIAAFESDLLLQATASRYKLGANQIYDADAGFVGAREAMLKAMDFHLLTEDRKTVKGFPTRIILAKGEKYFIRIVLIADAKNATMAQAIVLAKTQAETKGPDAQRFLDSLEVDPDVK
jgi:hypothetical protein